MRISKFLMSLVAAAVMMAFTAAPGLQAATYLAPSSKAQSEVVVDHIAAKKQMKKAKKHKKAKAKKAKKAKSAKAAPGKCGVGKYYKKGKCLSK